MRTDEATRLDRGLLVLAGVVLIGAVAVLLDTTIVGVALDAIGRDFDAPEAAITWVVTSYLLSIAMVTPIVGWSVDRFGAKVMWIVALGVFLIGSVLCAMAWSVPSLVIFRVIKGIGGGMILPLCQAILAKAAGPQRFGRIMSLVSVAGLIAPVLGPVLGGFIVDGLGWRWIFLINVPICLLGLVLAWRFMPADGEPRIVPIDWVGLLLLPPGLALMVYGFSRVHLPSGLGDPTTIVTLALGTVLVIGFCAHALRVPEPLVDLRLFRFRTFSAASALTFLHGVASYAPLFLLPLFYSRVRGHDAEAVGWLLAPQGVGTVVAVLFAGVLADRYGARPLVLSGTAAAVLGTVVFTQLEREPDDLLLGASLFLRGVGLGLVGVSILTAAYRDMATDAIARATGVISVVQRLGASAGTAMVAVVLAIALANTPPTADATEAAGDYGTAFWVMLIFMLISFVPAFLLPRKR
ncbi:MAG: multidrug efflux MFS transporter [Actinomycetota bacterium]|nr:multidrug efflux MFS transporter [Actinomycetota bacterium]